MPPRVWRDVRSAHICSAGPGVTRRTRWWVLLLSCEHTEERNVTYRALDPPVPPGTRRPAEDALPPPVRVGCAECTREAFRFLS